MSSNHMQQGWNLTDALCPLLVVPDKTRLACLVQSDVCTQPQQLTFDILGLRSRGGAPLFRIQIAEIDTDNPQVSLNTLDRNQMLAFMCTGEAFSGVEHPCISIYRSSGELFGTLQKRQEKEYRLTCGDDVLMYFTGNFIEHNIEVRNELQQVAATVDAASLDEYEAHVHAKMDAGLVILGLIAIDKCEAVGKQLSSGSCSRY